MAIYKPNSCYPFLSALDLASALSEDIFFECEIETSNVRVDGYAVTILDSDGEKIFGGGDISLDKITLLSDLRSLYTSEYASGLNGSLFKFPLFRKPTNISSSVDKNSLFVSTEGGKIVVKDRFGEEYPKIQNGYSYRWTITFFQLQPSGSTLIIPTDLKYYDMTITSGKVLGSNNERIQSELSDKIYSDYYIQPVYNYGIRNNGWIFPSHTSRVVDFDSWTDFETELNSSASTLFDDNDFTKCLVKKTGSSSESYTYYVEAKGVGGEEGSTPEGEEGKDYIGRYYTARLYKEQEEQIGERALIKSYDSTFGHIYPTTGENGLRAEDIKLPTALGRSANAFHIYKFSNQDSLLGVTDKVDYCPKYPVMFTGWTPNISTPGNSYAQLSYRVFKHNYKASTPSNQFGDGVDCFHPWDIRYVSEAGVWGNNFWEYDPYGHPNNSDLPETPSYVPLNLAITTSSRIVLNYQKSDGDSPIYIMDSSDHHKGPGSFIDLSGSPFNGIYSVSLHGRDFYVYDVESSQYKSVSQEEWDEHTTQDVIYEDYVVITLDWIRTSDADSWGELSNKIVRVGNDAAHSDFANQNIQIQKRNATTDAYGTINETPFSFIKEKPIEIYNYGDNTEKNTTGIIYYNIPKIHPFDGQMFIRPTYGINSTMMWIENVSYSAERRYFRINSYDPATGKITYSTVNPSGSSDNWEINTTKYKICSYYKESDENTFDLSSSPEVNISCYDLDGQEFSIESDVYQATSMDFEVRGTYSQKENVSWKSFEISLIDSEGEVIQTSGIRYEDEISAKFFGLLEGETYSILIRIEDQKGLQVYNLAYIVAAYSYQEAGNTPAVSLEYRCDQSVGISIGVATDGALYRVLNHQSGDTHLQYNTDSSDYNVSADGKISIYKREVWYSDDGELGGQKFFSPVLIRNPIGISTVINVSDYNISSNRYYEYLIFVDFNDISIKYLVYKKYIKTRFNEWTLSELEPQASSSLYYKKYTLTDSQVWKFKFNFEGGSFTQNISKTANDMLGQYPLFSVGPKNYYSGHVSCLIGDEISPFDLITKEKRIKYNEETEEWEWEDVPVSSYNGGGYKEELSSSSNRTSNRKIDMLNAWKRFCASQTPKLLKDSSGQSFIVQISNPTHNTSYGWEKIPTSIEFDWTEIGSTENCVIIRETESVSPVPPPPPPVTYPIYGVSWVNDNSTTMTRTDDAAEMASPTFSSEDEGIECFSPFDEVFPWNEATVETIDGNKMLHMPEMWFRVETDPNAPSEIVSVAVSKSKGDTGHWYNVKSFYYSCYGGSLSGSTLKSVSGVARADSMTRANFRSYAAANGSGYTQLDLYHNTVMLFLWWIEFATKNPRSIANGAFRGVIVGSGTVGGTGYKNTGGTDGLATPTGIEWTRYQMRWHYIEDFVGNKYNWVDGIVCGSTNAPSYVTSDSSKYTNSSSDMSATSYNNPSSSDQCIMAFGWDPAKPFLMMPTRLVANSQWNTGFCNIAVFTNAYVLCVGSNASRGGVDAGVCCFFNVTKTTNVAFIGARLIKSTL